MIDFFKDLNFTSRELIVSLLVTCCFWIVPICLFKTDIFNLPFYAQMALIFALSLMWYLLTFFSSVLIVLVVNTKFENTLITLAFISAVLLCVSILISYYYSTSFRIFLQIAYSLHGVFFVAQLILFSFLQYRYKLVTTLVAEMETKNNTNQ